MNERILVNCPNYNLAKKLLPLFKKLGLKWRYSNIRGEEWKRDWEMNKEDTVYCITDNILTIGFSDEFYVYGNYDEYKVFDAEDFIKKHMRNMPVVVGNSETDNLYFWNFAYYQGNGKVNLGGASKENISFKHIIPADKFDYNKPTNSLKYNIATW